MKIRNLFNLKWLIAAILVTLGVLLLTHLPQEMMPDQLQENGFDKLQHIVAYGIITLFFVLSVRKSFSFRLAAIFFVVISIIAMFDELTQPLVNRQAGLMDWLADLIGVTVVLLSFFFTGSKCKTSTNVGL